MQITKKIHHAFFILFGATAVAAAVSCSQEISSAAEIPLPEWPPENSSEWPEIQSWNIILTDADGSKNFSVSADKKFLELEISGSGPVSVLAEPVSSDFKFFCPAGTVLPFEKEFSWEGGFTADCLKKFYLSAAQRNSKSAAENYASKFNWQKITRTLKEKAEKNSVFYNPWLLDQEKILVSIENGTFTAAKLSLKKTCALSKSEVFSGFPEDKIFSDYVPQNFSTSKEFPAFSKEKINKFLFYENPKTAEPRQNPKEIKFSAKIITVNVQDNSSFSLAINSLPI